MPLGGVLGQLSSPGFQGWGFFLKPGLEDTCCMSPGARDDDRGKLNPSFVHWPAGVSFEVSEDTRARRIVPEIELRLQGTSWDSASCYGSCFPLPAERSK